MKCKYSVYREYSIPYQENEQLRCKRISGNGSCSTIKAPAKLFMEIFKHFADTTAETTVWLFKDHLRFKTFIENDDDRFELPSTSFSMLADEFSSYSYKEDMSSTFNVRDLKAFLDFATYRNQIIHACLQSEGKPIEFAFSNGESYSARIQIATIEFPDSERPEPPPFKRVHRVNSQRTVSSESGVSSLASLNTDQSLQNQSAENTSAIVRHSRTIEEDPIQNDNANIEEIVSSKSSLNHSSENLGSIIAESSLQTNRSDSIHESIIEIKKSMSECPETCFSDDSNRIECNPEEIENIVEILDNLPNFGEDDQQENEDIPFTSTQIHLILGTQTQSDSTTPEIYVPESDEDEF